MGHQLAILLLSLGAFLKVVHGGECEPSALEQCRTQLRDFTDQTSSLDRDEDYPCGEASGMLECFGDYAVECYDTVQDMQDFLTQNVEEVNDQVLLKCASDLESAFEALACLENIEEFTGECAEKGITNLMDTLLNNSLENPLDETKLECATFSFIMDCVVEKVNSACSSEISQAFREGVEEGSREYTEACENDLPSVTDFVSLLKKRK